jgi:molybdopterin-containing oxidoreductase family membrane subunit
MWVASYTYFRGLRAGSFLFSILIYVFGQTNLEKVGRMALVSAVLALLAGLLFVWTDLRHPERALNVILRWNATFVLAWEILLYLFYVACVFGELWYLMRCDLSLLRDRSRGIPRALYSLLGFGWRYPATREELEACQRHSLRITAVLGAIGIP